jgi:hypothetical protein
MKALQLRIVFALAREDKWVNKNIKVCYVTHTNTKLLTIRPEHSISLCTESLLSSETSP